MGAWPHRCHGYSAIERLTVNNTNC